MSDRGQQHDGFGLDDPTRTSSENFGRPSIRNYPAHGNELVVKLIGADTYGRMQEVWLDR